MKKVFACKIVAVFIFLIHKDLVRVQTSPVLICEERKTANNNDFEGNHLSNKTEQQKVLNPVSINKLFHNIQCTLEKAKPWVDELQQEAKRLEEAAKLLGLGILNSFGDFVDKLVEENVETPVKIEENSTISGITNTTEKDIAIKTTTTESVTEKISEYLCPEGFIADHNGICERVE